MGAAVSGIFLSIWLKAPIVTAWSAPGTALLVVLFPELSLNEAVGAYITAALIIFVIGVSGTFDAFVRVIPKGVAAGMMAGILFQFGLGAFAAIETTPALAIGMLVAYAVGCGYYVSCPMLFVGGVRFDFADEKGSLSSGSQRLLQCLAQVLVVALHTPLLVLHDLQAVHDHDVI